MKPYKRALLYFLAAAGVLYISRTAWAKIEQDVVRFLQGFSVRTGATGTFDSGSTFDHKSGATLKLHGLTIASGEMGALDGVTLGETLNSKVWTSSAAGKTTLVSGDSLDFASGSVWQIAATTVTSSGTELNYNDITTLGSSQNSKVLTADANGVVTIVSGDVLDIASGGAFKIAAAQVTSAADELNYVDITTLGAVQASKAVTASASGKITFGAADTADFNGGVLAIGGTAVGASATEIDYNDITALGTTQASKAWTTSSGNSTTLTSGHTLALGAASIFSSPGKVVLGADSAVTLGASGKTVTLTSGATLAVANGGLSITGGIKSTWAKQVTVSNDTLAVSLTGLASTDVCQFTGLDSAFATAYVTPGTGAATLYITGGAIGAGAKKGCLSCWTPQ